jgi:Spy/CpxP family protein refolding chaperone
MKSMFWSMLVLTLAVLPLSAQAGPRGGRPAGIARALNLTEAQKTSIHAIREKHRPDLVLRRDAAQQAQAALRSALQDATTPEARLRALHDKAASARFEVLLARRSVHQEVQALLTPEQRTKAAELRGAAQERRRERMRQLQPTVGMAG